MQTRYIDLDRAMSLGYTELLTEYETLYALVEHKRAVYIAGCKRILPAAYFINMVLKIPRALMIFQKGVYYKPDYTNKRFKTKNEGL